MEFMDKNFLLDTECAEILYHKYAEHMPIIDYHCHIPVSEIADDVRFCNISDLWLGADHYKWRIMRACGVPEDLITGSADPEKKFEAFAASLQRAIGNPLYHWSHLELRRYFGIEEPLTPKNALEIYDRCNEMLRDPAMSARNLVRRSNVRILCTTDDPCDDLKYHKQLADDESFPVQVLPAFRPDSFLDIEKPDFAEHVEHLGEICDWTMYSLSDLKDSLTERINYFAFRGAKTADHGLPYVMYEPCDDETASGIFRKRMDGGSVTRKEAMAYRTNLLLHLAREYHRVGFVMQLHYGVKRDNNSLMFDRIGPNTGFDCIDNHTPVASLTEFLNDLAKTEQLPKTVLYSLNPIDNAAIDSVIGCFQDESCAGKIQHGSAWWFNDNKTGMLDQLTSLSNLGVIGQFIGMLTDSRSFLSYTRHEYFRRILCRYFGRLVSEGEYPADMSFLGTVVEDICYNNCLRYFDFKPAK
ncbi:MAG: glucuronate isomerase [Lachnospiraceae bacterium]|nr:glucuronate isomerase [Lachnospiraceae bacterium]